MTIGERIKAARERAGVTQVELGEKIGVSGVAIMRYEKNTRQPRLEQLQAIAAALRVSPLYLLGDETATMSRTDVVASMGLEAYLKSLGYEFIVGYEYEGEKHDLCIDRKREKLYLLPPQRLEAMEQSLETFTKFSLSELVSGGTEISDTEGWFSRRQNAPESTPVAQEGSCTALAKIPPQSLQELPTSQGFGFVTQVPISDISDLSKLVSMRSTEPSRMTKCPHCGHALITLKNGNAICPSCSAVFVS